MPLVKYIHALKNGCYFLKPRVLTCILLYVCKISRRVCCCARVRTLRITAATRAQHSHERNAVWSCRGPARAPNKRVGEASRRQDVRATAAAAAWCQTRSAKNLLLFLLSSECFKIRGPWTNGVRPTRACWGACWGLEATGGHSQRRDGAEMDQNGSEMAPVCQNGLSLINAPDLRCGSKARVPQKNSSQCLPLGPCFEVQGHASREPAESQQPV